MVELGCALAGVANSNQIHMAADEKAAVRIRIFVDADGKDGETGLLAVQLEERGQFNDARLAPGGPEVEKHDLSPEVGKMDGGGSIGDGEVGSHLAGLGRMCATVAGRHEDQLEQQSKCE